MWGQHGGLILRHQWQEWLRHVELSIWGTDFYGLGPAFQDRKKFYEQFGKCLKSGVHEDSTNRVKIAEVFRYQTSKSGDKKLDELPFAGKSVRYAMCLATR